MDKFLNVNEAYYFLKEGLIVIDLSDTYFKLNKDVILIKNEHSSFKLKKDEFLELYKDNKFMLYNGNEQVIDIEKDKEYYGFKHK